MERKEKRKKEKEIMLTKLKTMLKRHEGFSSKPYRCTAKKLTIGYGRNLEDVGITKDEAGYLLTLDILEATDDAHDIFPAILEYSENRQIALINMTFNLGKTGLRKFCKMIKAVNVGDWEKAADEAMDSKWYKQVGVRAIELVNLLREG